jgi:hypothetical protein
MLKRQLDFLIVATILLSTTLVHAAEIPSNTDSSGGKIGIQTSDRGEVRIQTPTIDINPVKITVGRVSIDRNRRRNRNVPSMRRGRVIPSATMLRQQAMDRVGNSTTRTSTNNAHTVTEQHIQCSGSGSSISQSSQTINGRTVNSETRTNCN